jgi:hypothetical protein
VGKDLMCFPTHTSIARSRHSAEYRSQRSSHRRLFCHIENLDFLHHGYGLWTGSLELVEQICENEAPFPLSPHKLVNRYVQGWKIQAGNQPILHCQQPTFAAMMAESGRILVSNFIVYL